MNSKSELIIKSPGRINLIGEHIDYNDGYVLPAAINKCIYLTFKINDSKNRCVIKSKGFDSILVANLNQLVHVTEGWQNYVLGVLSEISKLTAGLKGFDCEIESMLPVGSGVSSSAALECGLAYGLNELFGLGLSKLDIIKLSQRAEHNYVGTNCGIMDQFSCVLGKEGQMILLDCNSLDFEYIPIQINPYKLFLVNTNVSHNLATGAYNTRRAQCEEGLKIVKSHYPKVKTFRDVEERMLKSCKKQLGEKRFSRCLYVIKENKRVLEAVKALKNNDLKRVGQLMYQTHEGLSTDYEVSCPELDFLVEFTKSFDGILGSRMMGGGFGGCTLNIIHEDAIAGFLQAVSKVYEKTFHIPLSSFITSPSEGTSIVK